MKYRKEIDGLRAIAVIPVILFHAGFSQFTGGFVGVDVFFVISGYLITTIILSEKESGTFSLLRFYERRARRVIPALDLVLVVSSFVSWFLLSPSHMKDFSQSLIAVSLFTSNILFWQETGYWGVENELKPLLHTWSLAVEEQYYVFFPLFIMVVWKFGKHWMLISFATISIASLLFAQWTAFNAPVAGFFLLPTRGWELAVGASVAFYELYRENNSRTLLRHKNTRELLSWLGLSFIAYAIFIFDENTPLPSIYTLLPTTGTLLVIIFSSKGTYSARLLASRLFVTVGLVSYSAYLWHQPLFSFARISSLQEPNSPLLFILSIVSLILAYFTWKYVETPFRNSTTISRKNIFSLTIFGSILFIVFGLIGHLTDGYIFRIDEKVKQVIQTAKKETYSRDLCENFDIVTGLDGEYCILVKNKRKFTFLYGDSHAQTLAHEAKKAFFESGIGLIFENQYGCPPVTGVYRANVSQKHLCYERNTEVYQYIIGNPMIDHVVLSARWALYIERIRFDNKEGGIEPGARVDIDIVDNGKYLYREDSGYQTAIAQAYANSVQSLLDAGKKVTIIYPIPEAGWNVPDYLTQYHLSDLGLPLPSTASTSYKVFKSRNRRAIHALDMIKENENLIRIFPESIFCNNDILDRCITHKNNVVFYKDDDHLSNDGARLVVNTIMSQLQCVR